MERGGRYSDALRGEGAAQAALKPAWAEELKIGGRGEAGRGRTGEYSEARDSARQRT